jgi:hypothetical protein
MATPVLSRANLDRINDDRLEAVRRNRINAQKAAFTPEGTRRGDDPGGSPCPCGSSSGSRWT